MDWAAAARGERATDDEEEEKQETAREQGERRGCDEEIGFALQSRWSAIMGHSVGASTRALIRYELSNYIIIRGTPRLRSRCTGRLVEHATVFRFSRGTKFSGRRDVTRRRHRLSARSLARLPACLPSYLSVCLSVCLVGCVT